MNALIEGLNRISESWWLYVFHAGWQAAVVGAVVLGLLWLGYRWPSPVRYWILVLALIKFASPPLMSLHIGLFNQAGPVIAGQQNIGLDAPAFRTPGTESTNNPLTFDSQNGTHLADITNETAGQGGSSTANKPQYIGWKACLMLIHLAGVMAMVFWVFVRLIDLHRMAKTSELVTDGAGYQQLISICRKMRMRRVPWLLLAPGNGSPFSFGLIRPSIIIPKQVFNRLSSQELVITLTHELNHHRRGNLWVNSIQIILCSIWWFHPVIWLINRALRISREDCCDDHVLAEEVASGSIYCQTLLQVASPSRSGAPQLIVRMAGNRQRMARRLYRIMDGTLHRSARLSWTGLLIVAMLAVLVLPGLRTTTQTAKAETQAATENAPGKKTPSDTDGAKKTIVGTVVDEAGKPIAGADICMPIKYDRYNENWSTANAQSDGHGRFKIEFPMSWLANIDSRPDWKSNLNLFVYKSGHQLWIKSEEEEYWKDTTSEINAKLEPPSETSFIVQGPDRKPLAEARVEPTYFLIIRGPDGKQIDTAQQFTFLRQGIEVKRDNYQVPKELLAKVSTITDANGRARLPAIPRSNELSLDITAPAFGTQRLSYSDEREKELTKGVLRLRAVGRIEGRIIAQQPDMARDIRLTIMTSNSSGDDAYMATGMADVVTDSEGKFIVPAMASGSVRIWPHINKDLPVRIKMPTYSQVDSNTVYFAVKQSGALETTDNNPFVSRQPIKPKQFDLPLAANKTLKLDLPLVNAIPVNGRVYNKDTGEPIAGADIGISFDTLQTDFINSDEQGRYSARVLPGEVTVNIYRMPKGFIQLTNSLKMNVPADAKKYDVPPIEAYPAHDIAGRLHDRNDKPIRAAIAATFKFQSKTYKSNTTSDLKGNFTLTDIPSAVKLSDVTFQVQTDLHRALNPDGPSRGETVTVVNTDPLLLRINGRTDTGNKAQP